MHQNLHRKRLAGSMARSRRRFVEFCTVSPARIRAAAYEHMAKDIITYSTARESLAEAGRGSRLSRPRLAQRRFERFQQRKGHHVVGLYFGELPKLSDRRHCRRVKDKHGLG